MPLAPISADRLATVDWLLQHGLRRSALGMLGESRGRAANERRRSAEGRTPVAGVYVLVTRPDGTQASSLPAEPLIKKGLPADTLARAALENAVAVVRADVQGEWRYAHVGLTASAHVAIEGASVGLAAALALNGWIVGRGPLLPVFATGALLAGSGAIGVVDFVEEKVRHALDELGDQDGLVLVPFVPEGVTDVRVRKVANYRDAANAVFGTGVRVIAPRHQNLRAWLRELMALESAKALESLDAVDSTAYSGADEALIRMHRGNHLRHVGRTDEARQEHDRAWQLAEAADIDLPDREKLRLEICNTQLEFFQFEDAIDSLQTEVAKGLSLRINELEFRGTLSRAFAMRGDFATALQQRESLMPLHDYNADTAESRDRSLNEWMLVAGLARVPSSFKEAHGRAQHLQADSYTTQATVRAHVLLGSHGLACEWYDGRALPPALQWRDVEARAYAGEHPFVSVARALVRALRRSGRGEEAVRLAERVRRGAPGLVAWLGWTVTVEAALSWRALGRLEEAEMRLVEAREGLKVESPYASRHHEALLVGSWDDVDAELERIFY
jgi:tetratricopeptide (TPR) repeat protein